MLVSTLSGWRVSFMNASWESRWRVTTPKWLLPSSLICWCKSPGATMRTGAFGRMRSGSPVSRSGSGATFSRPTLSSGQRYKAQVFPSPVSQLRISPSFKAARARSCLWNNLSFMFLFVATNKNMKLKLFQRQDLARAALKDGLILSWDTGLGKTWALYLWPLLKVGLEKVAPDPDRLTGLPERIRPKAPVLIVAPGDLHQQISDEGRSHFGVVTRRLDSQETFMKLTRQPGSVLTNMTPDGRPIVPPGFYITSYTQLTTNGVEKLPDPQDWEPRALLEWFALGIGEHQPPVDLSKMPERPFFTNVCHFFAWRAHTWRDAYDLFNLDPGDTLADLDRALQREESALAGREDEKQAEAQRKRIYVAYEILKNLCSQRRDPRFADLNRRQQDFVIREFCAAKVEEYSLGVGESVAYPVGPPPPGYDPAKPETDNRPKWRIKCVYSPSLADLAYNAFDCVVIDEGVKMKGEETLVGKGVRSMTPAYRLVLTAPPVKNRLPDIFRLAWWATGGRAEAHAGFPYRDETSERAKFAETFMVTERNLTKEAEAQASGKKSGGRYKKLTAEVCNVHRLWKLFGPIILRRRKQDAGVDIVPKVRKVIRCEMGTMHKKVYQYHLEAEYRDINGKPAIGAQLQALRMAAADPSSLHLTQIGRTSRRERVS